MGMLDEEQNIGRRIELLTPDEMLLKLKSSQIIHRAEIFVKQFSHRVIHSYRPSCGLSSSGRAEMGYWKTVF